jgi:membrane protein required for colicin V production
MSIVDIVLAIILCFFVWKGYKNGLIKELASLTALIAGIFIAIRFSDLVASVFEDKGGFSSEYLPVISFAIIFITVVIVILVFAKVLDKFIKAIKLQWLNKSGGILFSVLKSMLILGGLFFFICQLNQRADLFDPAFLDKSFLFKPFVKVFEFVFPYAQNLYP